MLFHVVDVPDVLAVNVNVVIVVVVVVVTSFDLLLLIKTRYFYSKAKIISSTSQHSPSFCLQIKSMYEV